MNMNNQFSYEAGDIDESMPTDPKYLPALMAAMIAIEAEHPGSIYYACRAMALVNGGFKIKATTRQPELSLKLQKELNDWILDMYKHMLETM